MPDRSPVWTLASQCGGANSSALTGKKIMLSGGRDRSRHCESSLRSSTVWSMVGFLKAELLDAVADLIAVDAEQLARVRLVAIGAGKSLQQQLLLDFFELNALRRQFEQRGD